MEIDENFTKLKIYFYAVFVQYKVEQTY
jgi:hypothetical protein